MSEIKNIKDADVKGKRVLMRVDFNVPLDTTSGSVRITDDSRIKAAVPTIQFLQQQGAAKIILLTHIGRPEGKVVETLRAAPVAARLAELVDMTNVELHENLRFDPREEANDVTFAQELAALGDVYVNEAFPVSHRADASIVGIPKLLPSFAGLHFIEELEHITPALTPPAASVAVIGGAKFETKQPLLEKLSVSYGTIYLGGALANDLLKSRGMPVGASLISDAPIPESLSGNEKIHEPVDAIVSTDMSTPRAAHTGDVRVDDHIVDIGEKTAEVWSSKIQNSEFVLWNGPTGIYEKGFVTGTDSIAEAISKSTCRALIGGGDTAAALSKFTFDASRVFVSTAGGAMLQFLADGTLPGIEALKS